MDFEKIKEKIKKFIRNIRGIKEKEAIDVRLYLEKDIERHNAIELYNQMYQGSVFQIEQIIRQLPNIGSNNFYKIDAGTFYKMHNSTPGDTVDMLVNNIVNDFVSIEVNEEYKELFEKIYFENDLRKNLGEIVRTILIEGDGAFVINYDNSNIPIIKFYNSREIEIEENNGKFNELTVKHIHKINGSEYYIFEKYGWGYIKYNIYNKNGDEIDREYYINNIDDSVPIEDNYFDDNICLAIPIYFFKSKKYKGRGKSLFEGKIDAICALDEVYSSAHNEIRVKNPSKFINDDIIPRNKEGYRLIRLSALSNMFIARNGVANEDGKSEDISEYSPVLYTEAYNTALLNAKLNFLQGIASAISLGLDVKDTTQSGVSRKEQEKQTFFTINAIEDGIKNCYGDLLLMCILSYCMICHKSIKPEDINVVITFNQFGGRDWGELSKDVGQAKTLGVISIYQAVKRLNKDWTEEEIQEEVQRIKEENGMIYEDPYEKYNE